MNKNIIILSILLLTGLNAQAQPGFNGHGPNDFTMSTIQNNSATPLQRIVDNAPTVHHRNYYHKFQMINVRCDYPCTHNHHEQTNLNSDVSI